MTAGSQSWVTSELTRGGRQIVGLKDCLSRILLLRSNKLSK
jgi:hypothetical protein